ncbi:MAG: nucleoside triphosphate pyrophosphohydrolase [Pseudarcicella sp.]|nr:nucleoside triphosphate pyrophosphohydrolase [Pseudarcicella sp.]MBP6409827.1 nucleoside triphosphate pyrophosphohydrolase [Pseudarcicella sp.]
MNFSLLTERRKADLIAFDRILTIMDELRELCPWDKKQTFQSLRHLTIEETYELSEALLDSKPEEIKKEIGDVWLHLIFYCKIASETNLFNIEDTLNSLAEKLIHRHPHIYGDAKIENEEQVKAQWEKLKLKEGNSSVLAGVPKSLPAMIKAMRIQDKVKGVGFDFEDKNQVWEKVQEEIQELKIEISERNNQTINHEKIEDEFGDVLFSLINYARFININPETALEKTNIKFTNRFNFIEKKATENNQSVEKLTIEEMETYWNMAKKESKK